jgi:hypothetical protein
MKTCAAGAMLIGGVLGASSTASAGLTWLGLANGGDFDGYSSMRSFHVRSSFNTFWPPQDAYDNEAFGAATYSNVNVPGASVSFSGLTPSGENANSWSTSAIVLGAGDGYDPYAGFDAQSFFFSVTGTQQVTLTTAAGLFGGSAWQIWTLLGGPEPIWSFDSTVGTATAANTQTFTLLEGQYYMNASMLAGAGFSGDMFSFTVPAPGAAALVGMAGLITGRRRKA